ncbi:hypothetical protein PAL_GLEAN10015288 [Pteropus alecto]|uniref:Uncharacterized protein n=1 Tax=Pteropus alecto TaxID=9402 RepID=L5KGZ8_PTEAL|nr:hypothetical protein PAL_GLEAN10015288 [Pteropus alecto]
MWQRKAPTDIQDRDVQGAILEPQIQPRPRRAFDVRGPLPPLKAWRQNIQLLERVGKDKKQVGAFHYLLGFIYRSECPSHRPFNSVGELLGFILEPSGAAICLFF